MEIKTRKFAGHGNYVFFNEKHPIEVTSPEEGIPATTLNHFINIANGIFNYKLIVQNVIVTETVLNLNLDLNLLKQSNLIGDQVVIGVSDKVIDACFKLDTLDTTPYTISAHELVNMFNTTYVSKDAVDSALHDGNKCPFKIFVPSKNSAPEDFTLIMYGNNPTEPELTHVYSSDTLTLDVSELVKFRDIVSGITITASKPTIQADDTLTLSVTSADTSVTEIYAEPVYGIISKTRIPLVNGVGNVTLSSLGLSAGDPIRVKFGYKYFTSVVEYTNTVT